VHRRVADEDHVPALVETAQHVAGRHAVGLGEARPRVDLIVDAVVEVVPPSSAVRSSNIDQAEVPSRARRFKG